MEVVYFIGVNRLKPELEYIAPDNVIKFDNMALEWGIKDQKILFIRNNDGIFVRRQFVSENSVQLYNEVLGDNLEI